MTFTGAEIFPRRCLWLYVAGRTPTTQLRRTSISEGDEIGNIAME